MVADQNVENYNGFYISVRVCHRIDFSNLIMCYRNEFLLGHSANTNCLCILTRMYCRLIRKNVGWLLHKSSSMSQDRFV